MDEGGAANTWGLWWVMKRREGEYSRVSKEGKEAVPVSEVEQGGGRGERNGGLCCLGGGTPGNGRIIRRRI